MLDELLVIVSAELILLASIAAISLYGRRMDVLSGRYFSNPTDRAVSMGWNIDRLRRWVERERKVQRLRKEMDPAQRYGELVADLEPHCAGLGEPQMVGVGGASSADQTGLRRNEFEVGFVAESTGLANRKYAFVDLPGSVVLYRCGSQREIGIGRL
jgi:hypothetical protein